MNQWDRVALTLIILGALNWLLVGLANMDVVATIFGGTTSVISRIIYIIIGLAGLWAMRLYAKPRAEEKQS
ncbi:MAG TPA: DUF378 domain-containing protein [Clostridia bacterium]|jgi:uncharacterized membrane protein YuzA (DUF378 family)|nr:DUF378 domain-containing protein [Clostridia bacterium]